MTKFSLSFCGVSTLAIVALLAFFNASFAQKMDWQASGLASPFPAAQTEAELIEQLRSAPPQGKAMACKQLSIYGSAAAVPELAKLLSDEKLASWARIALEAIPDPVADKALVDASKNLQGKLLVGVINSIGARQSAEGVEPLVQRLGDKDLEVAASAAVALGKIGGEQATKVLRDAIATSDAKVRSAVAEGCVLCAEKLLAEGNNGEAAELYEIVRKANVPKQRKLDATRGAIIARGEQGIPLLVELLNSNDETLFRMGLSTARELAGKGVVGALSEQLASAEPERASLIVYAIGDRPDVALTPSIIKAASTGDKAVRLAAIRLVGRLGNASVVPALLEIAGESDAELSETAKKSLAGLAGKEVDRELATRLSQAKGKSLATLIELVGQRRIEATPELVKALGNSDASIRKAAYAALGATVGPDDLNVLIESLVEADSDETLEPAKHALHEAAIRMPNREATAAKLAEAISNASPEAKASLLATLGAMGGPTALETISEAVKNGDDNLKDVGTRVLGEWMTADAGPVLLEISQDPDSKKYQVRALRGYLRIARQLKQLPDSERIAMAREALKVAQRQEERELAIDVLERCPSAESIELATSLVDDEQLRPRAVQAAIFIGEKIKDKEPAAAKAAAEKALKASPPQELADRAKALTSP